MTDPIADFLTRIRNGLGARHATCDVAASRIKEELARILQEEGYIESWAIEGDGTRRKLVVKLKYGPNGEQVIRGIERTSRPGRRVFCSAKHLPKVLGGLGMSIISTSRGVVTDQAARKMGVGGEVVCSVW